MNYGNIRTAFTVLLCIFFSAAHAQSAWHYLTNTGYGVADTSGSHRSEDVFFTDPFNGYCVTLEGYIFKTTDGGESWTYYHDSVANFRAIEFLDDDHTGIAGSLNGRVRRTTDAGTTWVDITSSLDDTIAGDGARNICGLAHFGNTFYAVGWWGGKHARIYKSTDKGITWHTTYIDTTLATNLVDAVFTSADTGYASGGINTTTSTFGSNKAVVIKTTDGGLTWHPSFSDTLIGGRIWKIQYLGGDMLVGSLEPYYFPDTLNMIRTTDGGNSWTMIAAGTRRGSTYTNEQGIGFVTPLRGFIGGYFGGLVETYDGGVTWDTLDFGANINRIFVLDSTHAYAGGKMVYRWGADTLTAVKEHHAVTTSHKLYPVHPNPAHGDVLITFDLGRTTNVNLQVANITTRKTVQILNKQLPAGHYTCKWEAGDAPNGNYIVWLGNDEIPQVQRFVLAR